MQCQKCGIELKDGVKFCTKCGHDVTLPFIEKEPFFSKLLKTIIQNATTEVWYKRWWIWVSVAVVVVAAGIITASFVLESEEHSNEFPKIMYVNAKAGLRMRAEPSTDSIRIRTCSYREKIQVLERSSTPVTIDGVTDYWYKAKADFVFEGNFYEYSWVFGGFLSDLILPDGSKYVGQVRNGKPHGQGKASLEKNEIEIVEYAGQWEDGKKHGHGTYTYGNGGYSYEYVGQWKDDKQHGQGTEISGDENDSTKYIGQWENGKRHGHGTETYYDEFNKSVKTNKTGTWNKGKFVGN